MTPQEILHFRDRLRDARLKTLEDAEDFVDIVQVLEDLGRQLRQRPLPGMRVKLNPNAGGFGLGAFERELTQLVQRSDYRTLSAKNSVFHSDFKNLFVRVRIGRNGAVHDGVFARHLAGSSVELSLILEDALTMGMDMVKEFMVRNVVTSEVWQPLSFIRLTMLKNSFSYLPVNRDGNWKLISDFNLASYLDQTRPQRLMQTLGEAIEQGLKTEDAYVCCPDTLKQTALEQCNGKPILVVADGHLEGVVTPFDLL